MSLFKQIVALLNFHALTPSGLILHVPQRFHRNWQVKVTPISSVIASTIEMKSLWFFISLLAHLMNFLWNFYLNEMLTHGLLWKGMRFPRWSYIQFLCCQSLSTTPLHGIVSNWILCVAKLLLCMIFNYELNNDLRRFSSSTHGGWSPQRQVIIGLLLMTSMGCNLQFVPYNKKSTLWNEKSRRNPSKLNRMCRKK